MDVFALSPIDSQWLTFFPLHISRRNELFNISGIRGQYPQFFLLDENNQAQYVGNWDTIEGINDNSDLPDDVLEANPSIITWEKVLQGVITMH